MRAGILTLFVITTEFSLIFRGKCDGCKEPDQRPNTKPVGNSSYTSQSRFRMECMNDYVRKAGTSNLFQCVFRNDAYEWKNYPRLDCIPDPKRRTTQGNGDNDVHHDPYKGGITTGVVFVLIVVLGATVALLLWCRRRQVSSTQTLEMTPQRPESDYSLLNPASGTRSNPSDTSQETPVY
ncbi:interleukin-15 receptor subunit alpha isoform X3 [Brachyhypopomus gauderio]|uniref:interleukin-15 receptor subunit alpha isoform X3 n=1 Tax=Brachyhypopomus gauderio TaxID=698409 RepID=UPI004041B740